MIKRWWRREPARCWVIKQIDEHENRLHLCESGRLETRLSPKEAARLLASGEYRGGVRLGDTGIVLNSALFAALVPWETLSLDDRYRAEWRGRRWTVSRVPQRCWAWEGRLVAEPTGDLPAWQSTEDLSHVRARADASYGLNAKADFRPADALEAPEKDIRDAIACNRAQQKAKRRVAKDKIATPKEISLF